MTDEIFEKSKDVAIKILELLHENYPTLEVGSYTGLMTALEISVAGALRLTDTYNEDVLETFCRHVKCYANIK